MRAELAEKLLVKIMNWNSDEISRERPLLQALATLKYDEYQQFSPGIRFVESLVKWLVQFEGQDRKTAYDFILKNLIFISNDQISHLVNITFSEKINPILIQKTASELSIGSGRVKKIVESPNYKEVLRRSLFIGVSDGSKIDLLRRSKKEISNEQVFPSYHISDKKATDMIKELNGTYEGKFNSVFLIDDFTASGKSYYRLEDGKPAGKINSFINSLYDSNNNNSYKTLIDTDGKLNIHVLFYIATRDALQTINDGLKVILENKPKNITCSVDAVQVIERQVIDRVHAEVNFMNLICLEKHFDNAIVDDHYKKGKHDRPYLGFNECSLPLILNHNTPNNSLPILWFPDDSEQVVGLFPRVTRHKNE